MLLTGYHAGVWILLPWFCLIFHSDSYGLTFVNASLNV
jgi:hypothetical protein